MKFGQFSVSLSVKDIAVSQRFYEKLGFVTCEGCGSVEDKWLILQKDDVVIGLFQDMFDKNILTFNPDNARSIEQDFKDKGITIASPSSGESGPTHFIVHDPDGNPLMFDQHF